MYVALILSGSVNTDYIPVKRTRDANKNQVKMAHTRPVITSFQPRQRNGGWGTRTKPNQSLLETAVHNDDLYACQQLLSSSNNQKHLCTHDVIRLACRKGSNNCLAYLLQKYPTAGHINHKVHPNMFVLAFCKSLKTSRILLQSGVPWSKGDFIREHDGQTVLHIIYQNSHYTWMKELTELVFTCGYNKSDVNATNWSGTTAIHVVVGNVFRRSFPGIETDKDEPNQAIPVQADCIIETLQYLVSLGGDLHAVDNVGRGVVHYLLMNASKVFCESGSHYLKPLPLVNKVLFYLLQNGVDINTCSLPSTSTPFTWLTSTFSESSIHEVETVWDDIHLSYKIMCEYGADVNVVDSKGISPVSLILTACNRWLRHAVSEQSVSAACEYVKRVKNLIEMFLEHGYNPTVVMFDFYLKQVAILLNIIDVDSDVAFGPLLKNVRDLILPFFLYGYDPNKLQMVLDEQVNEVCTLHARFYVSRSFVIHRHSQAAYEFLTLFENTLDQPNLVKLIDSICHILNNDFPHVSSEENMALVDELKKVKKYPQSLKSLSRISIAKSLNWNLLHKVDFLPLPTLMREYLVAF